MEQLYRDFTVCKRCGATCYLGNDYCEDCVNEMWQKLKEFIKNTKVKADKEVEENLYGDENIFECHRASARFGICCDILDKMQELEKEMMKSE